MSQQVLDKKESKKICKDIKVFAGLTGIYCRRKHGDADRSAPHPKGALAKYASVLNVQLCEECRKLVLHGSMKRIRCPMDPKPACKHCPEHCYQENYRHRVREVMRFSWRHLIKRGRFDLIARYM